MFLTFCWLLFDAAVTHFTFLDWLILLTFHLECLLSVTRMAVFLLTRISYMRAKSGPTDVQTIRKIAAHHRPMVSPTAAQLQDISMWSCLLQPSEDQVARVRSFLGTSREW